MRLMTVVLATVTNLLASNANAENIKLACKHSDGSEFVLTVDTSANSVAVGNGAPYKARISDEFIVWQNKGGATVTLSRMTGRYALDDGIIRKSYEQGPGGICKPYTKAF